MEIRIVDRTRFEYHERSDGRWFIKTPSGYEFPIPNYQETVYQAIVEDGYSCETTVQFDLEGNLPRASLFEGGDGYVGYRICKLVTGEWHDGKSTYMDEDEVIEIVEAAEQRDRACECKH